VAAKPYKSKPIAGINASGELVAMLEPTGKQLKSLIVFALPNAGN
jgi:hypothetical protein